MWWTVQMSHPTGMGSHEDYRRIMAASFGYSDEEPEAVLRDLESRRESRRASKGAKGAKPAPPRAKGAAAAPKSALRRFEELNAIAAKNRASRAAAEAVG